MRILFLLRANGSYNTNTSKSGLLNSARMTKEALDENFDVETKLKIVVDSNGIDRQVNKFKPHICVLEAIWVTPEKMKELHKLHKKVRFVIRVHSETPFLANEGVAISRIKDLARIKNVYIAFNSFETTRDFTVSVLNELALYLPNIYDTDYKPELVEVKRGRHLKSREIEEKCKGTIDIGCFGAIRPMKNQLIQAMAAIEFANSRKLKLNFHMNCSRLEQGGENVYKNIKALFEDSEHDLVEHGWMEREEFLELISKMDLGMQLSFNESFNIVTADFVKQNVPIIVSPTISWMPEESMENPELQYKIVHKMEKIYNEGKFIAVKNKRALKDYNKKALLIWKVFIMTSY